MKQKFLLLMLALKLGFMFIGEMYKVMVTEWKDKTAYPQSKYNSCLERSTAMVNDAMHRPLNYCACLIAHHREDKHGEGHLTEIVELNKTMIPKDVKKAQNSRGFWMA